MEANYNLTVSGVRKLIYYNIAAASIIIAGIFVLSLLFERKHSKFFIVLGMLCIEMLSFYIFYYIGSYKSSDDDVGLNVDLTKLDGDNYMLNIDMRWNRKLEIFGLNGGDDALVVRYDPEQFEIVSADRNYDMGKAGMCLLSLPKDFSYSKIGAKDVDIRFAVKDGENCSTKLVVKNIKPGGSVKVFFIHDYKIPLESKVYWEKSKAVEVKVPG